MNPDYGQKIIESNNEDGSVNVRTEGYFKGLVSIKEQTREDIQTSINTLLTDVIKCLDILKTDTPDLLIWIRKDKYGSPAIIQKTWTIKKEKKH